MHRVSASTAVCISVAIWINSRRVIVRTVPYIAVTCRDSVAIVHGMIKGEIERYHAVATRCIGGSVCRGIGGCIVCVPIPK